MTLMWPNLMKKNLKILIRRVTPKTPNQRALKKSHVAFSFEIMDLKTWLQPHLPASKYVKGRSKSMLAKTCRQSEGVDGWWMIAPPNAKVTAGSRWWTRKNLLSVFSLRADSFSLHQTTKHTVVWRLHIAVNPHPTVVDWRAKRWNAERRICYIMEKLRPKNTLKSMRQLSP